MRRFIVSAAKKEEWNLIKWHYYICHEVVCLQRGFMVSIDYLLFT
jgi:hypothetical protein